MSNKKEFWVTNVCRHKDISIDDLRVTIRIGQSKNLLDSRHFSFTIEQLENSLLNGSLFKKSHLLKVRKVAPKKIIEPKVYLSKDIRISLPKFNIKIEEPVFEDLDLFDEDPEKFAAENADMEEYDRAPLISLDNDIDDIKQ